MSNLEDIMRTLRAMPQAEVEALYLAKQEEGQLWFPNAGPQAQAALCPADEMLYGGQGGGGKTDLGLGLAFTAHRRSLVLRRQYSNLTGLIDRSIEINGTRKGFNGSAPPRLVTGDDRLIQFAGCKEMADLDDWQGIPFDYKFFDEVVQFLEAMVTFHLGWIRSSDVNVRARAVLGSNPPVTSDGDWIIKRYRPWLDLTHSNPAKHGELRWFARAPDGEEIEVAGAEPVQFPGALTPTRPKSRTFIPAALKDNPYLLRTDYQSTLDGLPEPLRTAVRDGNFMAGREDATGQVIPTAWIVEAQQRWTPEGFRDKAMTAMALDPAGGGKDDQVLCWRHGGWYAPFLSHQGKDTAEATKAMNDIFMRRRDGAPVIVDVGGGYSGAVIARMSDNRINFVKFNGANKTGAKSKDTKLSFANKRAEAWWRFREELDPNQYGGSAIALPPDPELRADLSTPCLDIRHLEVRSEIKIESKDDIRQRLGRSPGKGDTAVMCLQPGESAVDRETKQARHRDLPARAHMREGPLSRRRELAENGRSRREI